jgi:hypothetical protein
MYPAYKPRKIWELDEDQRIHSDNTVPDGGTGIEGPIHKLKMKFQPPLHTASYDGVYTLPHFLFVASKSTFFK